MYAKIPLDNERTDFIGMKVAFHFVSYFNCENPLHHDILDKMKP